MAKPIPFSSCFIFLLVISYQSNAIDIGVIGKRYAFAEDDYYDVLMAQVNNANNSGVFTAKINEQKDKVSAYLERPTGVFYPPATEPGSFYVDMTYQLPQAVVDGNGKVLYPQGYTFNPLDYMHWNKQFCFIDSDFAAQVLWAEKTCTDLATDRIILVKGRYLAMLKHFGKPIYFDQQGQLGKRFGLRYLPSRVFQEGNQVKVQEYVVQ